MYCTPGCTIYMHVINYAATEDDGSCVYPIDDCTDCEAMILKVMMNVVCVMEVVQRWI